MNDSVDDPDRRPQALNVSRDVLELVVLVGAVTLASGVTACLDNHDGASRQATGSTSEAFVAMPRALTLVPAPRLRRLEATYAALYSDGIPHDLSIDAQGNTFLTGTYFDDAFMIGGSPLPAAEPGIPAFVASFDALGKHRWSVGFTSTREVYATSIHAGATGEVVVGGDIQGEVNFGGGTLTSKGRNDMFVVKLDSEGRHLWSSAFGAEREDLLTGVALHRDGAVTVVGAFAGSVDFGGGALPNLSDDPLEDADIFMLRLDRNGGHVWSRAFGSRSMDQIDCMTSTTGDDLMLAGNMGGDADLGGFAWSGSGAFVGRFDPEGNAVWVLRLASNDVGTAVVDRIAVDPHGQVVIAGSYTGTLDVGGGALLDAETQPRFFVAKLSASGAHLWSLSAGGASFHGVRGLSTDSEGHLLLSGNFAGELDLGGGAMTTSGPFDQHMFVAKLDHAGKHVWSKSFADAEAASARMDGAGYPVVTSWLYGTADFGTGPLTGRGIVLSRLAP